MMKVLKKIVLVFALLLPTVANAVVNDSTVVATAYKVAPTVVRVGTSVALNIGVTELLKSTAGHVRPDFSSDDSWPSRHSSWIFTAASIASHELYDNSGWWVIGSHVVADAVAMQRIYSNNHFPKDVIAGAVVGLISTELGYLIGDLFFPGTRKPLPKVLTDWVPGLDVTTMAVFPLTGGANKNESGTAIMTSLRFNLPLSDKFGFTSAVNLRSMPLYFHDIYKTMINSAGLSAGVVGRLEAPHSRWSFEGRLMPGFTHNFDGDAAKPDWCFTTDITVGADYRLTGDLLLGAEISYSYWALRKAVHSLGIGIYSRVLF